MNTEIRVAIVAGIVTAIGWLVSHILERFRLRREARARYLGRQIEELYGPLFNLPMEIITTNHVRAAGELFLYP